MMHRVISLKYRPKDFDELYNQQHVKKTLINAIKKRKIAHAYLFAGPRGIGKTTTARILAKALNCEQGITPKPCNKCSSCIEISESRSFDVIEIDGASNRNIDEIRNIRENIRFKPTKGRYRIYIIDEVHMLTHEAFNALLKTLEEPPSHAVFIFATTAPHKVPQTVISRCQRFDFRKITEEEIVRRLSFIKEKENIDIEEDALWVIARSADGSMRDAESLLEQVWSYVEGRITAQDVEELLGIVPTVIYREFIQIMLSKDEKGVFDFVDKIAKRGYDFVEFYYGLIKFLREAWLYSIGVSNKKEFEVSLTQEEMMDILGILLSEEERFKKSLVQRYLLEILLLRLKKKVKPKEKTTIEKEEKDLEEKKEKTTFKTLMQVLKDKRPMLAAHLGFVKRVSEEDKKLVLYLDDLSNIHAQILKKEKVNMERLLKEKMGMEVVIEIKEEREKKKDGISEDETKRKIKKIINLFDGEIIK